MKIVKTMAGHLKLIAELIGMRMSRKKEVVESGTHQVANVPLSRAP